MKKTKLKFNKTNGHIQPEIPYQLEALNGTIKEGQVFSVTFENIKENKSISQLGWLMAEPQFPGDTGGIYYEMIKMFKDIGNTHMFNMQMPDGRLHPIAFSKDSCDSYMKKVYDIYRHDGKVFNKTGASSEELNEYIRFLDIYCVENFGCPLPPPKMRIKQ